MCYTGSSEPEVKQNLWKRRYSRGILRLDEMTKLRLTPSLALREVLSVRLEQTERRI